MQFLINGSNTLRFAQASTIDWIAGTRILTTGVAAVEPTKTSTNPPSSSPPRAAKDQSHHILSQLPSNKASWRHQCLATLLYRRGSSKTSSIPGISLLISLTLSPDKSYNASQRIAFDQQDRWLQTRLHQQISPENSEFAHDY